MDLYLGIQAVDVFVRDLEQSLEFYVSQLGFKLVSDVILQSGRRRVGVSPPDGNAGLNLIAPEPDAGEEFGEDRLIDALWQNRGSSPQNLLNSIVEEVRRFSAREQHDDITLIIGQCR
jgi:catechol 2,3-dioxygenase-like lactoylglutathione lyase family enzyme